MTLDSLPRPSPRAPVRVLELYAGIGGCAAALGSAARVVAAVDINRTALEVYGRNFPHPVAVRTIESIGAGELAAFGADLWWASPPCQPFTRRGRGRDDEDPRSRSLLALIDRLAAVRPPYFALENVPGFAASRTHRRLLEVLARCGYAVEQRLLCPTELGVPNRRRRFYLVASRNGPLARAVAPEPAAAAGRCRPLAGLLDPEPSPALRVPRRLLDRYRSALDLVRADDPEAVTACFTAAYGRSPVRSGSYLASAEDGVRRFSPAEILRLLGFPERFSLPPELPLENGWRLAGNSLSVPAVRAVLAAIPGLARARARSAHSPIFSSQ